jgi:predicted nucleic acid-binding protein
MNKIDPGEGYAIALAVELQADWIILDDLGARKVATDLGLKVTGLGGILLQAKAVGSIGSVKEYLDLCVEKANFRLTREVYHRLLQLAEEE